MRVKVCQSSLSARDVYADRRPLIPLTLPSSTLRSTSITCQKRNEGSGTVKLKLPGLFNPGGNKFGGTLKLAEKPSVRGRRKGQDPNTVLVMSATGLLGTRIVRELLNAGFRVRAGCRDVESAQQDFAFFRKFELISAEAFKNLTVVDLDTSDEDSLDTALGNAGKVVFVAGGEVSKSDRIGRQDCISLINASVEAGVGQFVLVTSLGVGKAGRSPSFFTFLDGPQTDLKRSEEELEKSGIPYTIVRPGATDRVTDAFKDTHNVVLDQRDKRKKGQVSNLQVAELITACCASPSLAANKVLEVVAETNAELVSYEALLEALPPEITEEELQARAQEKEKIGQEIAELMAKVSMIEDQAVDAQERKEALQGRLKELKGAQKEAASEAMKSLRSSGQVEKAFNALKEALLAQEKEEVVAKALYQASQKVSREGRILTNEEEKEIEFVILNPEIVKQREEEEAQARKEAEEKALAEKQAKEEAEAKAKKAAEAKAEQKAQAEAKVKAKKAAEAEAKAQKEAAAKAKAEAKAKKEAEDKAKQEAEAKAKQEAEMKAKAEAEAKAKQQAEAKAKQEAEAKAKQEAEAKAKKEAEAKAKLEAEAKAKQEAEAKAKKEAEAKAKKEAEIKAQKEAEAKAKKEAEIKAKKEADAKAKQVAEAAAKEKARAAEAKAKQDALQKEKTMSSGNGFSFDFFGSWKAPWDKPAPVETNPAQQEAKAWIDAWKANQSSQDGLPPAEEWIAAWKEKESSQDGLPPAKEWIDAWKAKQTNGSNSPTVKGWFQAWKFK